MLPHAFLFTHTFVIFVISHSCAYGDLGIPKVLLVLISPIFTASSMFQRPQYQYPPSEGLCIIPGGVDIRHG